jgi:CRP-like cAMP-binding protein
VQVDDKDILDLGPGVLLGERALLEGGVRTAAVTAATAVRVAVVAASATGQALARTARNDAGRHSRGPIECVARRRCSLRD